jgi:hypothetical protein
MTISKPASAVRYALPCPALRMNALRAAACCRAGSLLLRKARVRESAWPSLGCHSKAVKRRGRKIHSNTCMMRTVLAFRVLLAVCCVCLTSWSEPVSARLPLELVLLQSVSAVCHTYVSTSSKLVLHFYLPGRAGNAQALHGSHEAPEQMLPCSEELSSSTLTEQQHGSAR